MTKPTKEEFIEALYESMKESYPDCKSSIKEQIDIILDGGSPNNIIGMFIEDDVKKWGGLDD